MTNNNSQQNSIQNKAQLYAEKAQNALLNDYNDKIEYLYQYEPKTAQNSV